MQQYFYDLADDILGQLSAEEVARLNMSGEATDFVRINHAKVRQAGTVNQLSVCLALALPKSKQQTNVTVALSGNADEDRARLKEALVDAREFVKSCPEDPYLVINDNVSNSERIDKNEIPESSTVVPAICSDASDLDLVGIYCGGGVQRGFANSFGQRNWFETYSYNFDWSCYLQADKAVKSNYAGFAWDEQQWKQKLSHCRQQIEELKKPVKKVQPGNYRVYLSPAAMDEIVGILRWGGFSEKAIRTKFSCFAKMRNDGYSLSPNFDLSESIGEGVAPDFDSNGFSRPKKTDLISGGKLNHGLISARTGQEYNISGTGAEEAESPLSLEIQPGDLAEGRMLQELDTGLLINNLWYLNYSDRNAGRITGMTRFATFWVENGKIVGPTEVMRFDDSVYDFWGKNLVGLTSERDMLLSPETYYRRSLVSALLPGALVTDFKLTL